MQPNERDPALLWDMMQAAREILEFTEDLNFKQFEKNKVIRQRFRFSLVSEPRPLGSGTWEAIIGQRNILAHEYGEILVERIWLVAKENIPELIKHLEPLIPEKPPE